MFRLRGEIKLTTQSVPADLYEVYSQYMERLFAEFAESCLLYVCICVLVK